MNKAISIVIGVVLVVGIAGVVFFKMFISSPSTTPVDTTPGTNTTPGTSVVTIPPGGTGQPVAVTTISIATSDGGSVQVKDFKKDPATTQDSINSGHYYVGPHPYAGFADPTASSNPLYVIEYIDADQTFTIGLLQEPIATTRQDMEQFLMQKLGISQDLMCLLKYTVSVSWRVNPLYAGSDLGFSFCPGATPL